MPSSVQTSRRESWSDDTRADEASGCACLAIHHVLVPLDGSALAECALPWAVAVTAAAGARITLVRVLERTTVPMATTHHHDAVDWELRRTEARTRLAALDRELKARQLASSAELLEGRPAERIISFAGSHQADLIVLSSHGEGGLSGWALSSTALMIAARTRRSLLIVPAHVAQGHRIGDVRFRRLLVPLDCSPRAECVLPLATALARAHDAEIVLAHVVPEPEMPRRLQASTEDLAAAAEFTERNRLEGERYLQALKERLVGQQLQVTTRMAVGSRRARAIWDMAEQADADLVVVAAHGRTGDARERCGSVAARLLEQSRRPILVLQDLGGALERTPAEEAAQTRPGH
jgi:nucleotide-binding universal stress UspA family protein